jgi:hypothetical protein
LSTEPRLIKILALDFSVDTFGIKLIDFIDDGAVVDGLVFVVDCVLALGAFMDDHERVSSVADKHVIFFDPVGQAHFSRFFEVEFVFNMLLLHLVEVGPVDMPVRLDF